MTLILCQECPKRGNGESCCPVAEVRQGQLIIRARHHGAEHVSTFSLVSLLEEDVGPEAVNEIAVELLKRIK